MNTMYYASGCFSFLHKVLSQIIAFNADRNGVKTLKKTRCQTQGQELNEVGLHHVPNMNAPKQSVLLLISLHLKTTVPAPLLYM